MIARNFTEAIVELREAARDFACEDPTLLPSSRVGMQQIAIRAALAKLDGEPSEGINLEAIAEVIREARSLSRQMGFGNLPCPELDKALAKLDGGS